MLSNKQINKLLVLVWVDCFTFYLCILIFGLYLMVFFDSRDYGKEGEKLWGSLNVLESKEK